jgi:hypothetical protein
MTPDTLPKITYHPPVLGNDGKPLSTGNIIWTERDRGDAYYRVSRYSMQAGKFPQNHPCAPFDDPAPENSMQMGGSKKLNAFRARGYWASCFPEGDGITLYWWDKPEEFGAKTEAQVKQDIRECFGWEV